ncbi:craniofacial development protein 2-like protein [Plakobranchus ocellatus]|uniref:Craniofacial development protein 2-like protein n=1 Tax=Plakobranchus ocellatus TaxID=259542 RepID=A0AAV3YFA4_9GAST|nr:craniofacial development protein 2-like protein [Plakobranchus ocellatus]
MSINTNQRKGNDVKGWSANGRLASSGRDRHVQQVTPDRHPATVRKLKPNIKIATWNVRTMLQKGKLDNIKKEMERLKMNILGVSEVRWSGAGKIKSGKYEMYYSSAEHQRGVGIILDQEIGKSVKGYWPLSDRVLLLKIARKPVDLNIIQAYAPTTTSSDEEIEKFYEELEMAKTQCKSHEPLIIMGDFNAKVGEDRIGNTAGPHGLGKINERGERLKMLIRQYAKN